MSCGGLAAPHLISIIAKPFLSVVGGWGPVGLHAWWVVLGCWGRASSECRWCSLMAQVYGVLVLRRSCLKAGEFGYRVVLRMNRL